MADDLEARVAEWRDYLARDGTVTRDDAAELESDLLDRIDQFTAAGLTTDEAFLIAVGRVGRLDALSREYAREHSDRLWKHLVLGEPAADARRTGAPDGSLTRRPATASTAATLPGPPGFVTALSLAVVAGLLIKVPALFGIGMFDGGSFYLRNAALLVLPALACYFLVRRRATAATTLAVAVPFVVAAALLNSYPFAAGGDTIVLAALHAGVALWLIVGVAYVAGTGWRGTATRMDFVRFTGEWAVYYLLIAIGGWALAALTLGVFGVVGVNVTGFVSDWMLPCGACGAVVVAAWLVEAKKAVIENIAPVLTTVFTPLFTLMLLALVVAAAVQRDVIGSGRDLLIVFDIVLLVALALLLYSMSSRDGARRASFIDTMQLVMIVAALVVDAVVLGAMVGRIGEWGVSANRLASLGINVIVLVNLIGAAWLQWRFVRGRIRGWPLERWQMAFLPVYAVWAFAVLAVFPPLFAFA